MRDTTITMATSRSNGTLPLATCREATILLIATCMSSLSVHILPRLLMRTLSPFLLAFIVTMETVAMVMQTDFFQDDAEVNNIDSYTEWILEIKNKMC